MNEERKQQYFAELASRYSLVTGNATQDVFAKFLDLEDLGLTNQSVVHDNAAGPGTATQVLVHRAASTKVAPSIIATDYAPNMIHTLEEIKAAETTTNQAWSKVTPLVIDSANLSQFEDGYFTHSINNFSLFTITQAVQSLRETHRTLKSGGTAAVLLWKRFAIESMLASAQDFVKGEGYAKKHAVPLNGPQYFQEGVVKSQLIEAGFSDDKVKTFVIEHVLTEEEKWKTDGLYQFMTSTSVAAGSTKGWTEEEAKAWLNAVRNAMTKEVESFGGIKFEAWVTVAQK